MQASLRTVGGTVFETSSEYHTSARDALADLLNQLMNKVRDADQGSG
jgi:hypothetical protein